MSFDTLFSMVVEYTMEQQGVMEFFESLSDVYPNPRMGRWFVPGSRHYSWDKVRSYLLLKFIVSFSTDRRKGKVMKPD